MDLFYRSSTNMPITRLVKMTFRTESIDAFLQLFETKKKLIRDFPGCNHLELWQDIHNPSICFTYSKWETAEALERYRNSSFFEETWKATKQLFAGKPEAYTVHSS
jgi:heme-degrading monooxygenase HmoA